MDLDLFSLRNRHVLITGAGRGIGQAMALAATKAGAHVTAVSRTQEQLAKTQELAGENANRLTTISWDISQTHTFAELLDKAEHTLPVDSVIHAAGTQLRKPAHELSVDEWQSVQKINAEAPFFLSTEIGRRQLNTDSPHGSHIFICSLASTIGLPNVAPYAMSKSAILGAIRSLSREWANQGIRVNGIAPGYVQTQLTSDLLSNDEDHDRILGRIPAGRIGTPTDFHGIAVFLLSNASSYITGQMINVDGGWLAS